MSELLRYFAYDHLPEHLQEVSKPFAELAEHIERNAKDRKHGEVALLRLLEAKDAAVRAALPR